MPQLVRLVNNIDNDNKITNSFRSQLLIKPYSKISLVDANIRFSSEINGEDYNATGLTANYVIGTDTYPVTLDADYTSQTAFLNGVVNNFNYQVNSDSRLLDWEYSLNDNKVNLELREVNLVDADYNTGGVITGTWTTRDAQELTAQGNVAARYLGNNSMSRGVLRVSAVYDATDSTMRFGFLRDTDSISSGITFTGLLVPAAGVANYAIFYNDSPVVDLGYAPVDGDQILMDYFGGSLQVTIVDSVGNIVVGPEDVDLSVLGDPLLGVQFLHYVQNEGDGTAVATGGFNTVEVSEVRQSNFSANTATLNLTSSRLRQYLGFDADTQTKSAKAGQAVTFVGVNNVSGEKTSQGIIVAFEGVGSIRSYDGLSGKQHEILAVLPETANIVGTNDVIHTPPYKYQLDLNNVSDLRVGQMTVRFYTRIGNSPLSLRSGSVVSILLED